jgi:hypothetical protein
MFPERPEQRLDGMVQPEKGMSGRSTSAANESMARGALAADGMAHGFRHERLAPAAPRRKASIAVVARANASSAPPCRRRRCARGAESGKRARGVERARALW